MPAHIPWLALAKLPYDHILTTHRRIDSAPLDYIKFNKHYGLLKDVTKRRTGVIFDYKTYRDLVDTGTMSNAWSEDPDLQLVPVGEKKYFAVGTPFDRAIKNVLDSNRDEVSPRKLDRHGCPELNQRFVIQLIFDEKIKTLKRMEMITFKKPVSNVDIQNAGTMASLTSFFHHKELLWHVKFPGGPGLELPSISLPPA